MFRKWESTSAQYPHLSTNGRRISTYPHLNTNGRRANT